MTDTGLAIFAGVAAFLWFVLWIGTDFSITSPCLGAALGYTGWFLARIQLNEERGE